MAPDSSSASTTEESVGDFSVGRETTSTPATSPVFSGRHDSILETLGNFTNLGLVSEPGQNGIKQRLPDMLDPDTAAGIVVKNVCFVGAGYVGK
jgi:UDPglucose 6-dehydrogenase